jgi:hypothetical protein
MTCPLGLYFFTASARLQSMVTAPRTRTLLACFSQGFVRETTSESASISLRGLRPPRAHLDFTQTQPNFFFFSLLSNGIARAGPRFRRALSELHNSLAPLGGNSTVL